MLRFDPYLLEAARIEAGKGRPEAAVALDRSVDRIIAHERGRGEPTPGQLAAYATAYDCSVADFFVSDEIAVSA